MSAVIAGGTGDVTGEAFPLVVRQVVMVARDLEGTVDLLREVFGVEVVYRDPEIIQFGVDNAVLAAGSQFLEVIHPVRPDAPALRYLGDEPEGRGYSVLFQCPTAERPRLRARAAKRGYREIFTIEATDGFCCTQWHPRDVGAAMLEVDTAEGDELAGPWWPAGGSSGDSGASRVLAVEVVRIGSDDPEGDATRWAELLHRKPVAVADGWGFAADGTRVEMIAVGDGLPGVREVVLTVRDLEAVTRQATECGLLQEPDLVVIAGMRVRVRGE
jgi:hypothetical protein